MTTTTHHLDEAEARGLRGVARIRKAKASGDPDEAHAAENSFNQARKHARAARNLLEGTTPDPTPTTPSNEWTRELLGGVAFTPKDATDFKSLDVSDAPEGILRTCMVEVEMTGTPDHPNDQNLLAHLGANHGGQVKHLDLLLYSFFRRNHYTWRQGIGVSAGKKTLDAISHGFVERFVHRMDWDDRSNHADWGGRQANGAALIGGPLHVKGAGLHMNIGGKPVFQNTERAPTGVTFEAVTLTLGY